MPTNAINDTGVKYLYDKLHGEIEPVAEAVSDSEVTIEGNPLNFNTLSAQNAKSTILSLEPIQDLHGYDKPWVGGASDQLLDESTGEAGTIDLTTGADVPSDSVKRSDYMPVNTANLFMSSTGGMRFFWYDASKNYLSNDAITKNNSVSVPSSAAYFRVIGINSIWDNNIMINAGTTAKPYCPYENLCPITGRTEIGILGCGKNLCSKTISGCNIGSNGAIGTDSAYDMQVAYLKKNVTYTMTTDDVNGFVGGYFSSEPSQGSTAIGNTRIIQASKTITPTIDCWVAFRTSANYTTPQIEKGSIATSYSPYTESNDLTISLGQTVYGGTLDVENGVLVVDRVLETFSSNDGWVQSSQSYNNLYQHNLTNYTLSEDSNVEINWANSNLSEVYYSKSGSSFSYNHPVCITSLETLSIIAISIGGTSLSELNTFLTNNPLQICYELATPITINLTPHTINLLKGVNNISTDGDKITLTYRNGSVATLGDLTSAVDNLDTKIDESKILTDTATGDKYILVVTNGVLSVEQISN